MSDGAAVGQNMKNPRTALKYWKREKQRLHKIKNMANLQNTVPDYKLYDFGQPWLLNQNKNYVNFELSDHYFFALIIKSIMFNCSYKDIIFLGDGCGYLAQIFLKICEDL